MKNSRGPKPFSFLLILIVVVGGGWMAGGNELFGAEEISAVKGSEVSRGPMRISVVERGNLKAANSVTLKSEIEGRTTVLFLIEEGTEVQPGDIVAELDIASIVERKVQQNIKLQNALASFTKARLNFTIQERQNESDIARSERELEFARIDLEKYTEGDKPQMKQKADEDILLRKEEKGRAEQDLAWSVKLHKRGFLEQSQLEADRLANTRSEVALKQAQRAKELLLAYEIPRELKELEADVEESIRELARVKLQAEARLADFAANRSTSEATYDLERDEFAKLESQAQKAILRAPVAGMVVYAVEEGHRYGRGTPMQEGAEVRERQEIITIPSADGYVAEASIHETLLERVDLDLPCLVTIDALRETFRGEVSYKAVLPDKNSWFANPDLRVYRTVVRVLDKDPRMRPGMSCSVEILVDELEDALHIPVQSVFIDRGETIALVSETGGATKRPIAVGQNNGEWVEVLSGLKEGEIVLLSRPPEITLERLEEETTLTKPDWGQKGEGVGSAQGLPASAAHGPDKKSEQHSKMGADEHGGLRKPTGVSKSS